MAHRYNRINCFICDVRGAPRIMKRLSADNLDQKQELALAFRRDLRLRFQEINLESRFCLTCFQLINSQVQLLDDPTCIRLNVLRQHHRSCFVCNEEGNMSRLSLDARVRIFVDMNIFIPDSARCCLHHLCDNGYLLEAHYPTLLYINRLYHLSGNQLQSFLGNMRTAAKTNRTNLTNPNSLLDEDFNLISPVTQQQFQELLTYCDPVPVANGNRYVLEKHLLTFLCKLRQGLSDNFLKLIFDYPSRQAVSLAISTVRQSLMIRFVPENIGVTSITREAYVNNHVTEFANALYNPNPANPIPIAYIDGTYSYIEKSSNFRALRQSYSQHKGRHLVKPALVVAPDGYILDIHGPYFSDARNNDAAILQNEFRTDAGALREFLGEGGIVVVDRGYRDVLPLLDELGIDHRMPALLQPGERQLETEVANDSRLVTKTRWIVEARNGHIKSIFKFFQNLISVAHAVNLREFYLIAGAIINKYRDIILMEGATVELAQAMLEKARTLNVLQQRVIEQGLARRNGMWQKLNENQVRDFPILELNYLKELTVGIYQVSLAPAYIQDKVVRDGIEVFELDEHREEEGLIRVRLFSRFRNAVRHQLWITYKNNDNLEEADEPITGYYCTCVSGARTLGSCAHVASVLWFLGFARHQPNIKYPSNALLENIRDASHRYNQRDID